MSIESVSNGGDDVGIASGNSSPRNRMKFLCSYGGKIIPRPADGHLKYVGGETRVIGVPRDINFSELMKKLKSEFEGDMILKYQVIPEELDVLVSVRTDEDLKHMLDEYDRNETGGTTKLRAFLFPSSPTVLENQNAPSDHRTTEQRYVDAINNTIRTFTNCRPSPIVPNRPSFSNSASSSPRGNSPDSEAMPHDPTTFINNYHNSRLPMHRVHSSPSLYNLNAAHHQNSNHGNHHYYQPHHHHHGQHHQQHHPHSYQSSSRPPHEPHRLSASLSLGRPDFGRTQFSGINQRSQNVHSNWSSNGHNFGNKHEHSAYGCRTIERLDSHPPSPKSKLLE